MSLRGDVGDAGTSDLTVLEDTENFGEPTLTNKSLSTCIKGSTASKRLCKFESVIQHLRQAAQNAPCRYHCIYEVCVPWEDTNSSLGGTGFPGPGFHGTAFYRIRFYSYGSRVAKKYLEAVRIHAFLLSSSAPSVHCSNTN